jgi:hypothetical protein
MVPATSLGIAEKASYMFVETVLLFLVRPRTAWCARPLERWNPAAQRLFNYCPEQVIGRPISILAAPDRENEMPAILERIGRGERVLEQLAVELRRFSACPAACGAMPCVTTQTARNTVMAMIRMMATPRFRAFVRALQIDRMERTGRRFNPNVACVPNSRPKWTSAAR